MLKQTSLFKDSSVNFTNNSKPFHAAKKSIVSKYSFVGVMAAALLFASCQKEQLSNPALNSTRSGISSASASANIPPKVNAGDAKRVVYPSATSVTLKGNGSGAGGSVTFQWQQTSGRTSAVFSDPTKATTTVSNLKPGIYTFTLTATSMKGVSSTATTTVSVLQKMTWTVEGVTREALIHPSSAALSGDAVPIIFAFHGHGGTDSGFAEKAFELSWPEAMVIYPQGLPTESHDDQEARNSGWQHSIGEVNSKTGIQDQDVKFFDAMLATYYKRHSENPGAVFVHGWSNGGEFVYNVLWAARGSQLTALAPAAAVLSTTSGKRTIPVIHTAGTQDDKVSFSKQEKSGLNVRTLNKCLNTGITWATGSSGLLGTKYASPINDQEVFLQYNGSHSYPYTVPALIVKFFKEVAGFPNP